MQFGCDSCRESDKSAFVKILLFCIGGPRRSPEDKCPRMCLALLMSANCIIYTTLDTRCPRVPIFTTYLGRRATDTQFSQYIISLGRGRGGLFSVLCQNSDSRRRNRSVGISQGIEAPLKPVRPSYTGCFSGSSLSGEMVSSQGSC